MSTEIVTTTAAVAGLAALLPYLRRRLQLSKAKHLSLAGHSRMAKRVARLVPGYAFDESRFFAADGAPPDVHAQRRAGFDRLAAALRERSPQTLALITDCP